jgi:hypothetical protein
MTWLIDHDTKRYWVSRKGEGYLYKSPTTHQIKVASDGGYDKVPGGIAIIQPLVFHSRKEAEQAIIDFEAKPIADKIISNARKTEYTPPAIAIEARVKEMVKEAGK